MNKEDFKDGPWVREGDGKDGSCVRVRHRDEKPKPCPKIAVAVFVTEG